jgi:ethanolamine transporter EutH
VDTPRPTARFGVLGAGVAACAACCAGPVLGFLAATGIASVVGALLFGVVGLLLVVAVAAVLWQRRRRAASDCTPESRPVPMDPPQLL